ncbi:hypothetical protein [Bartonella choladocola]|uniref:hypothetical protein n=1 Tax=Bartonella choladocola TaxID=2750995 RepID=UPI0009901568|nr:hypothetical protein [Bartonella choladocola]
MAIDPEHIVSAFENGGIGVESGKKEWLEKLPVAYAKENMHYLTGSDKTLYKAGYNRQCNVE